ncbi:Cyclin-like domain-containing protein [Entamoeba marina]
MDWIVSKNQLDQKLQNFGDLNIAYKLRKEFVVMIKTIGAKLNLPEQLISLAILIRAKYMVLSSLVLSMKLEECRNITLDNLKNCFIDVVRDLKIVDQNLLAVHERKLLVGINFQLDVETPHAILHRLIANFDTSNDMNFTAWTFTNDMMLSHLCLTTQPFVMALIAFSLAAKQHNIDLTFDCEMIKQKTSNMHFEVPEVSKQKTGKCHLIEFYDIKNEVIQEIILTLRGLYESKNN